MHRLSAKTGVGMDQLRSALIEHAFHSMPKPGSVALNRRQRELLTDAGYALSACVTLRDPLLVAENLRLTRLAFDRLLGNTATEDVLDAVFGRFCIGK